MPVVLVPLVPVFLILFVVMFLWWQPAFNSHVRGPLWQLLVGTTVLAAVPTLLVGFVLFVIYLVLR